MEHFLSNTSECPTCKRPCELVDLKKINFQTKQNPLAKPGPRNRGRGALAKQYNTRSQARNLFQDSQRSLLELNNEVNEVSTPNRITRQSPVNSPSHNDNQPTRPNRSPKVSVDYDQLNRMIENNITRLLANLNLVPNSQNQTHTQPNENCNNDRGNGNDRNVLYNTANPISSSSLSNSNVINSQLNKITAIISGWKIQFDGSPTGLTVEEFLYRIRSLTYDNFNGDFSPIVRNLNVLLSGKARDWYWRYRKQVDSFNWDEFCDAIKCQYRDFKSYFDIREEIRNRRQKVGETFDVFYDSISAIMDRLPSPLSEMELIEILTRNLRPEIRQELLYIPVHSISHLRKLVHRRETFLNDEYVRKNMSFRVQNQVVPRRQISELHYNEDGSSWEHLNSTDTNVNAIQFQEKAPVCWNCDGSGHFWDDCVKSRNIFCYGCGTKNVYKPQCAKCSAKKINLSKNSQQLETMKPKN